MTASRRVTALLAAVVAVTGACASSPAGEVVADRAVATSPPETTVPSTTTTAAVAAPMEAPPTTIGGGAIPAPAWLGTRVLPRTESGFGEIQPTPPEMVDRRFITVDLLPPPTESTFQASVVPVPDDVLARSTWAEGCPISADELVYVTLPFVGFDRLLHTGELLVHRDAADVVVAGFEHLFARGFPIEEMRVVTVDDLDAPPTGDGNNTTAFVCRPSVGTTSWSQHAYGLAVDINPFHNPYVKGDVVLPELASAYVDRSDLRPGMLTAEDVAPFEAAGWGWGGRWRSVSDPMHLSANGR